ncbi:hypothetical protein ONZ45_g13553 [Pleurotus djamor]|nr:hypothetical protein ONZ45_g13553 [Pleurotus djamor]
MVKSSEPYKISNEILERIYNLLPIWETQTFRNLCHRHHDVLLPHPRIRLVSDSIRPFFKDVEKFRQTCLQPFDCLIGGMVPFLTLAGLPVLDYDIMDLFVTYEHAQPLCKNLENLGCQFYVQSDGISPSLELILSGDKYFEDLAKSDWDNTGLPPTFSPPSPQDIVLKQKGFPGPPTLGSTAATPGGN